MRCCSSASPAAAPGFAARCLAADYLYPQGGPHAEAVLKQEDTECLDPAGGGRFSGQIPVKRVREMREAIQHSALSTDAAGRVLFIYGAQDLNGSSANAMLKIIEEPPAGRPLPAHRHQRRRRAAHHPQPLRRLHRRPGARRRRVPPCCGSRGLPAAQAAELAFLYARATSATPCGPSTDAAARTALARAKDPLRLCRPERYLPRPGPADPVRAGPGRVPGPAVAAGPGVQRRAAPSRATARAPAAASAPRRPPISCAPAPRPAAPSPPTATCAWRWPCWRHASPNNKGLCQ